LARRDGFRFGAAFETAEAGVVVVAEELELALDTSVEISAGCGFPLVIRDLLRDGAFLMFVPLAFEASAWLGEDM